MKILREVFSPIEVNTFILTCDNASCIIIDCGCYGKKEEKRLADLLTANKLEPVLLLNTHCHLDHIFGNSFLNATYGLRSRFHPAESDNHSNSPAHAAMFGLYMEQPPAAGDPLSDGEIIKAAGITLEVIHVPGHSPGGVAFWCREESTVFTGDALFAGSIGRSDLPGGNHETLMNSIRKRLFTLPPHTIVYPGHGSKTTVAHEMQTNPFFV